MLSFRDAHDGMSNGCGHTPSGPELTRQGLVCLASDKYLGHFRMCEARRYPEATTSVGLHIEGLNLGEKTMGLQGSRPIHPCMISSYPLHPPWSITAIQVQRHHPHTPSISLLLPYLPSSLHTILVNCGGSDAPGMELPAPVLEGSERQVVSPFSAHARARYQSGDSLELSGTLPPTPGSLGLDAVRQATILPGGSHPKDARPNWTSLLAKYLADRVRSHVCSRRWLFFWVSWEDCQENKSDMAFSSLLSSRQFLPYRRSGYFLNPFPTARKLCGIWRFTGWEDERACRYQHGTPPPSSSTSQSRPRRR